MVIILFLLVMMELAVEKAQTLFFCWVKPLRVIPATGLTKSGSTIPRELSILSFWDKILRVYHKKYVYTNTHTHTKHKTSFLLENVNELYGKNLEVTEMITKKRFVV